MLRESIQLCCAIKTEGGNMSGTHVFADAQGGTYLKNVIPIPETASCRRNTAEVVFMVMLLVLSLPLGIPITWINFHLTISISVHLESYWNRPTAQLSVPLSEVLTPIRGKLNPWCPAHLVLPRLSLFDGHLRY